MSICENPQTWSDALYCIDPYFYAYLGVAISMGISIIGAAWYSKNIF